MASIIYNSAIQDAATGNIDYDTDTFKVLLVGSTYAAIADETKKDSHTKRTDVTNEITGVNYSTGGATVTATVTKDTANNRVDVTFANPSWPNATITANGAVIYKSTGTASADNLVAYVDFGSAITSTNGTFTVTFTSPLRYQN